MAGVPGVLAPSTNGGPDTRKPFTYCPGGINFSELKSPRMARRIAKHQSQMEPVEQQPQQQQLQQQPQQIAVSNNHTAKVRLCTTKSQKAKRKS
jgi:hypothetical protein